MRYRFIAILSVLSLLVSCVKDIPVSSITLDCESKTMTEGESFQLNYLLSPSDATDQTVFWTTDNGSVATVSQSGLVHAEGQGVANVTLKAMGCGYTASCRITVTSKHIPSTEIKISHSFLSLVPGQKDTLSCLVVPSDASYQLLTWTSSDPSVVFVDGGVVTAVSPGDAIVTASNGESSVSCSISVCSPVEGISIDKNSASIYEGESLRLEAVITPSDATDKTVYWLSLDETIATVTENGLVEGRLAGETSIMASNPNGKNAFCRLQVKCHVESVTIDSSSVTLNLGASSVTKLSAIISPERSSDKAVTWVSSNRNVVTVAEDGTLTATGAGEAVITVTTVDSGKKAECKVTVLPAAGGITLNTGTLTLFESESATLNAAVTPANAADRSVRWQSFDESIATVSSDGSVTAVKAGCTEIVATNASGVSAHCQVVVKCQAETITLDREAISFTLGEGESHADLIATMSPERATDLLKWTSSDESVVTVDSTGKISPVNAGEAVITVCAVDSHVSASCTVTVVPQPITVVGIALNKTELTLQEGASAETLVATISPSGATNQILSWSSSKPSVASVDGNGKVTPLSSGQSTICVTTADGGFHAYCVVTVKSKVTGLTLVPAQEPFFVGETYTLKANISPAGSTCNLKWSTLSPNVATVSPDGNSCVVTGLSAGVARISVSTDDGKFPTTVSMIFYNHIKSVSLDHSNVDLTPGQSVSLIATLTPSSSYLPGNLTWTSSNTKVATVDQNGKVTAVGKGEADITVKTHEGEKTASCRVNVVVPVERVSLSADAKTLVLGSEEEFSLNATITPSNASEQDVAWTSSNPKVAIINGTGSSVRIKAVSSGETIITAKSKDGVHSAECKVTVVEKRTPVTGVTLDKSGTIQVKPGETVSLKATVSPSDADIKDVEWSSSSATVAKVDNGLVTALAEGTTTITVTTVDQRKTAKVTINVSLTHVSGISLNKTGTYTIAIGNTDQLSATISPADADEKAVQWSSSNNSVVTVSPEGLVSAVGVGSATVTATSKDGNKTASCSYTVVPEIVYARSISLNVKDIDLAIGDSFDLVATVNPSGATVPLKWEASVGGMVSVDENGHVTAKKIGSATVTVSALKNESGLETAATCSINVHSVKATGLTLDKSSLTLRAGQTATLIATLAPANTTNKTVTWTSSSPSVATVKNGVITAVSQGQTTITARSADGGHTATCTIRVKPDGAETNGSEPIQIEEWN